MKISYRLTLQDYIAAIRLYRNQKLSRRFIFGLIYLGLPICAGFGLITLILVRKQGTAALRSDFIFTETLLVFIAIALPLARIPDVRKGFRRTFPDPGKLPTTTSAFDEECLRSEISGVSEGIFRWNAIVDFAQDDKITLLYIAKKKFLFFPTSIMSAEQRSELNDLINRKVRKRETC